MTQSKHTPGPWKVRRNQSTNKPACQITTKDKEVICSMAKGDFGLDDARLIAAAPELLAACEAALDAVKIYPDHPMTASEVLMRIAVCKAKEKIS
jgi:hypothetical protein